MKIQALMLQHFRSYSQRTIRFDPNITYIIGPNTSGKTNILEALGLLSTAKSFRGVLDREMIRWEQPIARVKVTLEEDELEVMLTTGVVNNQKSPLKKLFVNGVPRRSIDFVGKLPSIIFSPEDLNLVNGSPTIRRQFLDNLLVQADRNYRRELQTYEKGLRQRNKLLYLIREGLAKKSQLAFWNTVVIQSGQYLTEVRERFLTFCNTIEVPDKEYIVVYDHSKISEERLLEYEAEEIASKVTLVGPHRDNFIVKLNSNNRKKEFVEADTYGSRGEQRLSVLWLKLAALSFLVETTGNKPVLLLDDIFSELDSNHQQLVLKVIMEYQTIITSADRQAIEIVRNILPGSLVEFSNTEENLF